MGVNFFLFCLSAWLLSCSTWLMASESKHVPLTHTHDIHVSMCELRFVEETSTFQVSIKVFIDDLEIAMKKEGLPPMDLGSPKENEMAEEQIATYLNKYFSIDIDGKKWKGNFIGKELSEDYQAVWCYIEYAGEINKAKLCTLTNRILLDIYDDQRNIMDIRMSKTHKAYTILEPSRPSWNYTF